MKPAFIIVMGLSLFLGGCSVVGYNAGVKEPVYKSLLNEGHYEIREYPSIILVTAQSNSAFDKAGDESFQKLFDYISGNNTDSAKIVMTTPVLMEDKGTKIPMTAPVFMNADAKGWSMSFVLPDSYTIETAPQPIDKSLRLEERLGGKYAVLRFSGIYNDTNFEKRSAELEAWLAQHKLTAKGSIMRAGYNPPWTLPPLRRNEVMVEIK